MIPDDISACVDSLRDQLSRYSVGYATTVPGPDSLTDDEALELCKLPEDRTGTAMYMLELLTRGWSVDAVFRHVKPRRVLVARYYAEYARALDLCARRFYGLAMVGTDSRSGGGDVTLFHIDKPSENDYSRTHTRVCVGFKSLSINPSMNPPLDKREQPQTPVDNPTTPAATQTTPTTTRRYPQKPLKNPIWRLIERLTGCRWYQGDGSLQVAMQMTGWFKALLGYALKARATTEQLAHAIAEAIRTFRLAGMTTKEIAAKLDRLDRFVRETLGRMMRALDVPTIDDVPQPATTQQSTQQRQQQTTHASRSTVQTTTRHAPLDDDARRRGETPVGLHPSHQRSPYLDEPKPAPENRQKFAVGISDLCASLLKQWGS